MEENLDKLADLRYQIAQLEVEMKLALSKQKELIGMKTFCMESVCHELYRALGRLEEAEVFLKEYLRQEKLTVSSGLHWRG